MRQVTLQSGRFTGQAVLYFLHYANRTAAGDLTERQVHGAGRSIYMFNTMLTKLRQETLQSGRFTGQAVLYF